MIKINEILDNVKKEIVELYEKTGKVCAIVLYKAGEDENKVQLIIDNATSIDVSSIIHTFLEMTYNNFLKELIIALSILLSDEALLPK